MLILAFSVVGLIAIAIIGGITRECIRDEEFREIGKEVFLPVFLSCAVIFPLVWAVSTIAEHYT